MRRTLGRKVTGLLGSVMCAAVVGILVPQPAYAAVEPLQDYAPISSMKLSEDIDENWSFTTNTPYWSVLAVRPPSGWSVYTDIVGADGTGYLRSDPNGITGLNFVAIDSNSGRRPLGPHFGRGITISPPDYPGPGQEYTIMLAQGADIITAGTRSIAWSRGRFVAVRDIYLMAGQQVTVTTSRAEVAYLFASDAANRSTWAQPRDLASAKSSGGRLTYRATQAGWHGLVLTNRWGARSSTLQIALS